MKDEKYKLLEFLFWFLIGAIWGAFMGFAGWAAGVRQGFLYYRGINWYDSYTVGCFFIGGGAFLAGLFLALYMSSRKPL